MANLFARKPLDKLMAEAQEVGEHSLKRSLGPLNLIALGIGGIIGRVCLCVQPRRLPTVQARRLSSPSLLPALAALLPDFATRNLPP